jgi:prepilin-type N-terminal cleavage/methylation domain-containing protein
MSRATNIALERGFTIIELLVALAIFLLVTGAAFTLLNTSQQRYQTESQTLTSFQEGRLGLDQIVRDVNDSGFPPRTFTSGNAAFYASTPFAWSAGAGYLATPSTPCQVGTAGGGTCTTASGDTAPGDFDLIIETNPGAPGGQVQWIRYQLNLNNNTLYRGIAPKIVNDDPDSDTTRQLVPFVQNVANNSSAAQIAQYQAAYPSMFPGGAPVPIFSYTCDNSLPSPPTVPCPTTGLPVNAPQNIRDVIITLIVASPLPDATTGQPRLVQLTGRGRRINPNQ